PRCPAALPVMGTRLHTPAPPSAGGGRLLEHAEHVRGEDLVDDRHLRQPRERARGPERVAAEPVALELRLLERQRLQDALELPDRDVVEVRAPPLAVEIRVRAPVAGALVDPVARGLVI